MEFQPFNSCDSLHDLGYPENFDEINKNTETCSLADEYDVANDETFGGEFTPGDDDLEQFSKRVTFLYSLKQNIYSYIFMLYAYIYRLNQGRSQTKFLGHNFFQKILNR